MMCFSFLNIVFELKTTKISTICTIFFWLSGQMTKVFQLKLRSNHPRSPNLGSRNEYSSAQAEQLLSRFWWYHLPWNPGISSISDRKRKESWMDRFDDSPRCVMASHFESLQSSILITFLSMRLQPSTEVPCISQPDLAQRRIQLPHVKIVDRCSEMHSISDTGRIF